MLNFIGFLLPPLIDLINRKIKDTDVRFWVSVLVCLIVGFFVSFLNTALFDSMTILEIVEAVAVQTMATFGMAQLTYKAAWEDSETRDDLKLNAKKI